MLRRVFSFLLTLTMVVTMVWMSRVVPGTTVDDYAALFFVFMLILQAVPLYLTQRGDFGPRRHPANRGYTWLSVVGMVGTVLMTVVFFNQLSVFLGSAAGAMMFAGIVGSGVLAYFSSPWKEYDFRSHWDPRRR